MAKNFTDYINSKNQMRDDEYYMDLALKAAERAVNKGDYGIGAVIAWPDTHIIENDTRYSENDITAHAVTNVLRKASQTMFRKLSEATLYVTFEPEVPIALWANYFGVKNIVYGTGNINGFSESISKYEESTIEVIKGNVLSEQCFQLLPKFLKEANE